MKSTPFRCPHCHNEIDVNEMFAEDLREEIKQELSLQQKTQIAQAQKTAEKAFERRLKEEQDKLSIDLADLQAQLAEREQQAHAAQQAELALRKKNRELDEKQQRLDIELARKLDEARKTLSDSIKQQLDEEYQLKLAERDQRLQKLTQSLSDLKRRSEVGSQQAQGETFEIELEQTLMQAFPQDVIAPVPKGIRGADVLQTVRNEMMQDCGVIIWEMKNTKAWGPSWIDKLKDDQRACQANMAVLVSRVLPAEVKGFGRVDGVWVCDPAYMISLTTAIRHQLTEVHFAVESGKGKDAKMERVYQYLSGNEFKSRIEAIVDSFNAMQTQLQKERRAMEALWKEREMQISRMATNTVDMYGEMRGLLGSEVARIAALELGDEE